MIRNRVMLVVSMLVLASMILTACGPQTTPTAAPVDQPTEPQGPAEPVGRTGAWVDQVVFTEVADDNSGITQLAAGDIDIYNYAVSGNPDLLRTVLDNPDLQVVYSVGGWREIAFNTAVFTDTNVLNPFSDMQLREAMNYVVDRNYITAELQGGTAQPKLMPLNSKFSDYALYADVARRLEAQYAYDFERGAAIVNERMVALGAELVDGKWNYNGQPIVLVALVRQEWAVNWGNYFCDQMELLGFTVDRQIKNSRDAAAVWRGTAAEDGQWHIYTSGWVSTAINRDAGYTWAFLQTNIYLPYPYTQAYVNTPEFYDVALKLWNNEFATMEERRDLFEQAMVLGLQESQRIQLMDDLSFTALSNDLEVAADLAGGVQGSALAGYTIRFKGQEGGTVRMGMPTVLNDPWNPIGGSNFIYDRVIQRYTGDSGTIPNPYTGLSMPQRIAGAELVAVEGLPIAKTLDWVDLRFESEIQVPADVWVDWDAAEQRFITAAEKFPEGLTALTKSTVYYPDDLWTIQWHDGSYLSPADFVMGMILTFDTAKPESAIYDEATVSGLDAYLQTFKGVRIISTDPLVIETYNDTYGLDAEASITTWWPSYAFGQSPWHTIAVGIKPEAANTLAFSSDKATALGVEWMSFISGPSLDILEAAMNEAAAEGFVPYAALAPYLADGEVAARYANLQAFYAARGHFWVGSGPFYLDAVYPVENTVVVTRFEAYPDLASKWGGFGEPKLPEVLVDGPAQVKIGDAATFDVTVSFKGDVYPADEIASANYLLYGADGALIGTGVATLVADGQYQVVLDAATTGALVAGANKIEVVVVSLLVSIPQFTTYEFVTVP